MSKRILSYSSDSDEEDEKGNNDDPMELVPLIFSEQERPVKRARIVLTIDSDDDNDDNGNDNAFVQVLGIVPPAVPVAPPIVLDLTGEDVDNVPPIHPPPPPPPVNNAKKEKPGDEAQAEKKKELVLGARPTQLTLLWLTALLSGSFTRVKFVRSQLPRLFHLLKQCIRYFSQEQAIEVVIESLAMLDALPGKESRRLLFSGKVTLPADSLGRIHQQSAALFPPQEPLLLGDLTPQGIHDTLAIHPTHHVICSVHNLDAMRLANFRLALMSTLFPVAAQVALLMPVSLDLLTHFLYTELPVHELCHLAHELLMLALIRYDRLRVELILALVPDSLVVDALIMHAPALLSLVNSAPPELVLEPIQGQYRDMARLRADELYITSRNLKPIRERVHAFVQRKDLRFYKYLFPYQHMVLQWTMERASRPVELKRRFQGGVINLLPGMGKTRIGLAMIKYRQVHNVQHKVTLVLVPVPVLKEWVTENERLFPLKQHRLRLAILHDSPPLKGTSLPSAELLEQWFSPASPKRVDVVVSSIETFTTRFAEEAEEEEEEQHGEGNSLKTRLAPLLDMLIIDEIHVLSNKERNDYQRLLHLLHGIAPVRFGLTGTSFRNSYTDLLNQLALLGPAWYADLTRSRNPESFKDDPAIILEQYLRLEYGRNTIEITEMHEHIIRTPLDALDREVFDYIEANLAGQAKSMRKRQAAISLDILPETLWDEIHADILDRETKRRQKTVEQWEKQQTKRQLMEEKKKKKQQEQGEAERQHSSMVFSQSLGNMWNTVTGFSWFGGGAQRGPLAISPDGDDNEPPNFGPLPEKRVFEHHLKPTYISGRMARLLLLLKEILLDKTRLDEKVLVFSGFTEALTRAQELFAQDKELQVIGRRLYTGDIKNPVERDAIKTALDEDDSMRVLFLTFQSGGTGLNLQRANHVVHLDPPLFTDAMVQQVNARARRARQTRTVHTYSLISDDTYDERMFEIQGEKREAFAELLARGYDVNRIRRELDLDQEEKQIIEKLTARLQALGLF